jgi:hypothetical protein
MHRGWQGAPLAALFPDFLFCSCEPPDTLPSEEMTNSLTHVQAHMINLSGLQG